MKTVNEVSKLTGVSIRTLQYYDKIGLLHPAKYTESGYRLYDDMALERLQQILLFRELEFPLKEIMEILNSPDFDRNRALEQQIKMLEMKKEHLENLILFARGIQGTGVKTMDFTVFDTKKLDEYEKQTKEAWGKTPEYLEFEEKRKNWTEGRKEAAFQEMIKLFTEFGKLKNHKPSDCQVQEQVKKLQTHITENFYTCTPKILNALGKMYAGGGSYTESIDTLGGKATALFTAEAIQVYCEGQRD